MMTLHLTAHHASGRSSGKICFVDLAGSERVMESRTSGESLKETGHINKSLFTLGSAPCGRVAPRPDSAHERGGGGGGVPARRTPRVPLVAPAQAT